MTSTTSPQPNAPNPAGRGGQVPARQRLEAAQLAKHDVPAPDALVSAAARRYGEYLLMERLSNRLPRCLLPWCGALVALGGVLLWTEAQG